MIRMLVVEVIQLLLRQIIMRIQVLPRPFFRPCMQGIVSLGIQSGGGKGFVLVRWMISRPRLIFAFSLRITCRAVKATRCTRLTMSCSPQLTLLTPVVWHSVDCLD